MYLSLNSHFFQPASDAIPDPILDAGQGLAFKFTTTADLPKEIMFNKEDK